MKSLILSKTYVYTYDNAGNILTKKEYALTAAESTPASPVSTKTYTYGNLIQDIMTRLRVGL